MAGARGFLALALLVACGGAAVRLAESPLRTSPPPLVAVAPPAPRPVVEPRSAFPVLQRELAALRGRPFLRPVSAGVQSRDEFRVFVRGELDRELPPAKREALSRAYVGLGLASPGFDLGRALEEAYTSQVAAYYDPRTRTFHVVGQAADMDADREVVVHELTHALQDQYWPLEEFQGGPDNRLGLSDDEKTAREFVTEGEATFLMFAWDAGSGEGDTRHLGPFAVAGVRMMMTILGKADFFELLSAVRRGHSAQMLDAEARAELDSLARLPPLISLPLVEPYFKGAALVSELWGRGGWPAVDELYRHPPQSTEQVLHPAEKLFGRREPPIRMSLPADAPPALASPAVSEVQGELGLLAYFKTWKHPRGAEAAAGWGGDRFWAWHRAGGSLLLQATRWDSEADAREFFQAFLDTLKPRFPSARLNREAMGVRWLRQPDGTLLHVERRGRDVDLMVGVRRDEVAALQSVLARVARQ